MTRQEIYEAKTFEQLVMLGKKYGRQSPKVEAWANHIMNARKKRRVNRMKIFIIIIMFLVSGIIAGAQAEQFITFDNPSMTREERLIRLQVEKHKVSNNPAESIQSVRAIDAKTDVIEISQENTSLPPEYMALPTSKKDMRKYVGK